MADKYANDKLWNTKELATYMNCHPETIKRKARLRQIPVAGRIGGEYRFRKSSIDTWLHTTVTDKK